MIQREVEILRILYKIANVNTITRIFTIFFAQFVLPILIVLVFILIFTNLSHESITEFVKVTDAWIWIMLWPPGLMWLISTFLKYSIRAKRPAYFLKRIHPLFSRRSTFSFPSGHTTFMIALSVNTHAMFGMYWGIFFGCMSLLSAVARIAGGVHWPRDIIGSVMLNIVLYSLLLTNNTISLWFSYHP